jgi:hypothetical protein
MFFSMGLDKWKVIVYIKFMKINIFSIGSKPKRPDSHDVKNNDLMDFVSQQFKLLSKKNLRVPIKLYHL